MNKKLSKIFAVALVLVMCFAMAMPAFAGTLASTDGSGSITVSKNLIMNSDASVRLTISALSLKLTQKLKTLIRFITVL